MTEEGALFPDRPVDPGDARRLVHPPGYSILMMAVYGASDKENPYARLRLAQIILDAVAAVMLFLIAAELLPLAIAAIGGLLVAFSPHLAYYSLWLSPDNLAALPILIAIYFVVKATKTPRLISLIAAGVSLGLSCWFRSNALLLAPFIGILILALFPRGYRSGYALALVAAAILTFSPITISNYVNFGRFVPLSIGAGITMIEGIADYDAENRFGMPIDDVLAAKKDAEWHGQPDYAGNPWSPDGIERDRYRFARGLAVVRDNPGWFMGVMLRRAGFMLRYNDSGSFSWPFNTAIAPIVAAEPTFGHQFAITDQAQPVWAASPADMLSGGAVVSPQAALSPDDQSLQVTGDASDFGSQFTSAPIPVRRNTDYVLRVGAELERGPMALHVFTSDLRAALASTILPEAGRDGEKRKQKKKKKQEDGGGAEVTESGDEPKARVIEMPFASGDRSEVRLVLSNNGAASERPQARLGQVELFEAGPTPYLWTRYPRALVRGLQKNLYQTKRMLPLVVLGGILLVLARRRKALALLLAVPLYYLCVQSALHTEYRYILAIHYFLFVLAAVALYCAGAALGQGARWVVKGCRGERVKG